MSQIPLNAAASNGDNNRQLTTSLPPDVVQCLENARFLHLATCTDNIPTVSLMNYTYLPSSAFSSSPVIIMTTNPASRKMANLRTNPHVSLLVHDWVSHRPPTTSSRRLSSSSGGGGSPPAAHRPSSLASLLLNLNTSAMSSISATINGSARLVDPGTDEERFYRGVHLDNNTFEEAGGATGAGGSGFGGSVEEDGGRGCFVAGEEVRVIVVDVRDVRISDWKGNVKDWVLVSSGAAQEPVLNGVSYVEKEQEV
ncbi:hypothetical protein M406DRAFT_344719 [Cryphonectria parasitica EP155]|uniref:Pyridoxamine 5'-phosphate oxidase N-terminal domain-containing protein n=1 Tax=Cryphonectria parasitica (strain ATCC 38755 / EP155) TaxID=660469 RepID=A0A9P4Y8A9_CRYP1|nr:uncharacterized protein M406DRAFT_344719 [Cryphonectria parasitica EP155]KAF3768613.1 hypothetical protein M406DRAFT_344719 [Cryphonectria parasitica EP155]